MEREENQEIEQALTVSAEVEDTRKEIQLVQLMFSGISVINASNTAVLFLYGL